MSDNPSTDSAGEAIPSPVHDPEPTESLVDAIQTAPTAIVPTPNRRSGPFRIYSPDDPDLTDEMRLEIELRLTAGYWLHKALQAENQVDMPDEYRERKVFWKFIFQEALVVLFLFLVGWLLASGLTAGWLTTITLVCLAIGVIVGLYVYKLWRITFIVSTATKTGISRERVRWMFINEIKPELTTKDIIISKPYRNSVFSTFNVNWWRVRLDSAAQDESPGVQNLRFVRDGDRLVHTVEQYKLALR